MTTHRTHRWTAPPQGVRRIALPALTALLALLASCGSTSTTSSSSPTSATAGAGGAQQVSLTEWKVDAPTSLKAGQVALKISNGGTVEHELLVFKSDLDPAQYPTDSDGNIKEDGTGITKVSDGDNIAVGGSQTRTVDLTQPGKYLFFCNIPSHFKQGMVKVVTVTQ
jgi:uncharacterized cupredoxin-like copper-binding protein